MKKLDEMVDKLVNSKPEELAGSLNKTMFGIPMNAPIRKWSYSNRWLAVLQGATDARTYKTWQSVRRYVKAGAKAIYILAPMIVDKKMKCGCENGCERCKGKGEIKVSKLIGFRLQPEFDVKDTEGEPLGDEPNLDINALPLIAVAANLGINVSVDVSAGGWYGYFDHTKNVIVLCTDSEQTFFHELAHAADYAMNGTEKRDRNFDEVVAELTACFLASLYGKAANLKYTHSYIKSWSNDGHVGHSIMKALDKVEKIYRFIEEQAAKALPAVA
jgi:hypothetical protein